MAERALRKKRVPKRCPLGTIASNGIPFFYMGTLFSKGVPIFISASAISAYRHFFSISAYRLSANIYGLFQYENIGNIGILATTNVSVSAYRQKCHIGTPLLFSLIIMFVEKILPLRDSGTFHKNSTPRGTICPISTLFCKSGTILVPFLPEGYCFEAK